MEKQSNKRHLDEGLAIRRAPALPAVPDVQSGPKLRVITPRAPRMSLLTRPAKLVTVNGEFVCIIRNISQTGVKLHLFHDEPIGTIDELHTGTGHVAKMRRMRKDGNEVAYEFVDPIDCDAFVSDVSPYPQRPLRLTLSFPVIATVRGERFAATICDLSQQGARICCDGGFAIDQTLSIESDWDGIDFGPVHGTVRWRRETSFGLRLENTIPLAEFARLVANLQCPALVAANQT